MSSEYQTQDAESDPASEGMGITDVYYILFRRKWLVVIGAFLGLMAAVGLWKLKQPLYQSEAKLLVKYVVEVRAATSFAGESKVQSPDDSGASVIGSEIEILTSVDIAQSVAGIVGPEKILPPGSDTNDVARAAGIILKNLRVLPLQRSKIITIRFQHADAQVSQRVLQELIDAYLKKHGEIHRSLGVSDETLVQQREQLRTALAEKERRLKELRDKAGVHSLEDSKRENIKLEANIKQELYSAQADLAQRKASYDALLQQDATSAQSGTSVQPASPLEKVDEYRSVIEQINALNRKLAESSGLTAANPQVATNQIKLRELRAQKTILESNYPPLLRLMANQVPFIPPPTTQPAVDVLTQGVLVKSLEAKIIELTNQLATVRDELRKGGEVEAELTEFQRSRSSLEQELTYVERSLQQARFDATLGERRNTSISKVQAPSPPFRDFGSLYKNLVMAVGGGFIFGLIMAFLAELLFDRSLRRPKDVESTLSVPLFLSIPAMRLRSALSAPNENGAANALATIERKRGEKRSAAGEGGSEMKPYHDALRDRLVNYFDIRDMTHKPKLIAVTSCSKGAGVSSVATGLAASLSETGDGNVLLVDMRDQPGAAHAFYDGKPAIGLAEALENDTRTNALVHEHLYVVSAGSTDRKLLKILPQQFSHFVPKLKASDYDYIIFDMPPVGQTSVTAKVARFMDMVLMVVESEKTDRDVAKRASALLAEANATVATVLNKHRSYVPAWLQQELH